MRQRTKWLRTMSIALSCAMLATTAPMNVFATEVSAVAEIESVTVPVSLDLDSGILSYGTYGTWKENVPLSIEVNGVRTELKKDGSSTSIAFKNEDVVRFLASDVELYAGTANVSTLEDGSCVVDVISHNTSTSPFEQTYVIKKNEKSEGLFIAKEKEKIRIEIYGTSGPVSYATYDLIAKTSDGTPLQGITMTDNTFTNDDYMYWGIFDYTAGQEHTWGNGNALYYEEAGNWTLEGYLTKATDENGYADSDVYCTPETGCTDYFPVFSNIVPRDVEGKQICYTETVYANNGLVDIDTNYSGEKDVPYYATLESLGVEKVSSTVTPFVDEKGILGDYYEVKGKEIRGTDSLILRDELGNEIATVKINQIATRGNFRDNYSFVGANGTGYNDYIFTPNATIKMADGMDDWKVTTSFSNDKLHITAVKTVSTGNNNNTPDTSYEVTLPADKTAISKADFAAVLEANKTQDVVIKSNNNVTLTFVKGTMASVDGMENYDFGSKVVSDFANAGTMDSSVTKDNFVTRINYNYSGKLPAKATIKIFVGTDYADQTLYYSKIVEDGFKLIQSVKVDKDGYITVSQDSCSDYVVTTNDLTATKPEDTQKPEEDTNKPQEDTQEPEDNKNDDTKPSSPHTGIESNFFTYLTILVSGAVALFVVMQKKRLNK